MPSLHSRAIWWRAEIAGTAARATPTLIHEAARCTAAAERPHATRETNIAESGAVRGPRFPGSRSGEWPASNITASELRRATRLDGC